jgi:DinB superfamily
MNVDNRIIASMNDALRDFPDRLRRTVDGLSDDVLQRPEAEGKWSIAQVIAHLAQFEMIVGHRIRAILAADTPSLIAFDQERWIRDVYRGEPVSELIEQLAFIRTMNLKFIGRLREEEWNRAGIHPQYGHNTIRELIARFERHQEKHLRQIERIKASRQ